MENTHGLTTLSKKMFVVSVADTLLPANMKIFEMLPAVVINCSDSALDSRYDVCLIIQLNGLRISTVSLLEAKPNKHFR